MTTDNEKLGEYLRSQITKLPEFNFIDKDDENRIILRKEIKLLPNEIGKIHTLHFMPDNKTWIELSIKE